MKKIIARAPVRADLAGGTLDLWPIYLFHSGARTVNVAISYYAESEVTETGGDRIDVHLTDQQYKRSYASVSELASDPKAALIHRVLEHFPLTGVSITTRTDAPRGSGLGGSSALTITLVRALSELAGKPLDGDDLVFLVRDLETRLLGVPAGIQDYYPPVFGGLAALHLEPGTPIRHAIPIPMADLAAHFVLHYSGVAHFSGTNNWEMYKRQVEHDPSVEEGFRRIAATAAEMEHALTAGNFQAAGHALAAEWENRKGLIDGISTPEIDEAIAAARLAGAWGGKVCGAGGGGCIVFLVPPEKRDDVVRALATVPGRVLEAQPVAHGMTVTSGDDALALGSGQRNRLMPRISGETIEQLYVSGSGTGDYHPFLLAEAVITLSESRSGVHHTVVRSYVAPIAAHDGSVQWTLASRIDPEKLEIRAVPDPDSRIDAAIAPEALVASASQSEDAFRQYVEDNERLRIFHNPAFSLYSEANETREAFLDRCFEEAKRRADLDSAELESTFRRRIDQVRERSERDQRELDARDENEGGDEPLSPDLNLAWGQTLYNITSGRPAATADSPQSVRETDALEKIAQIRKAWDRELETIREDLALRARSLEEIEVVPSPRNIEITKYLILWAVGRP